MKKIASSLILIGFLAAPVLTMAAGLPNATDVDIEKVVNRIINWLFAILMILVVAFVIYAGILFVTAQGSDDTIAKARKMLLYAVIGVVVALISRGIQPFLEKVITTGD